MAFRAGSERGMYERGNIIDLTFYLYVGDVGAELLWKARWLSS